MTHKKSVDSKIVQSVVIVGGGFGGIKAALELANDKRFQVTLLSDQSDFRYYPSLYRAATGGAEANSSIPLTSLFDSAEVSVVQASATTLDRKAKTLQLDDGQALQYDILILSLGVVTNYFGIPGMKEYSYSIKSMDEIKRLKAHLHQQLSDDRRPDLNYVVIGAGPTGIELSGVLPEYLKKIMTWHGIKHRAVHVDLIEAAPQLLPRLPKAVANTVARRLKRVGVKLFVGQTVQGVSGDELTVSGKPIRSHTVIWTAGVTNHPFFTENNFTLTPRGKVATDMYLQADENIYVIGDNANTPYSGMAQTALYDGSYVAENLKRKADDKDPRSYKVKKPITVIPVGDHWATVLWGKTRLYGVVGWALREVADLIAFSVFEPWWKAGKQWLSGFETEEDCQICRAAYKAAMVDN